MCKAAWSIPDRPPGRRGRNRRRARPGMRWPSCSCAGRRPSGDDPPGALQVLCRVDPEWAVFHARAGDPHTILQRPQLFEALALLQRAWWQGDETIERWAAVSVDTDVVPARAESPGN